MKENIMISAIVGIDDDLIADADKAPEIRKKTKWLKFASVAAACVLVAAAAVSILPAVMKSNKPTPLEGEVVVGWTNSGNLKEETTGHYIGVKCPSFYTDTKLITLEPYMAQLEDEGLDGYPVFEVYQGFTEFGTGINRYREGCEVKINGGGSKYEKRFTLSDLDFLTIAYDENVFDGHSEKVTLDFSDFEVDEAVSVTFSYGFFYYKNNPFNQPNPDNSLCANSFTLNFYIGERGISVSANSMEGAIAEYERLTGEKTGMSEYIDQINRSGEYSSVYHSIKQDR